MVKILTPYTLLNRTEAEMVFGLDTSQFGKDLKEGKYNGTFVFTPSGERRFKTDLLDQRIKELCEQDGVRAAQMREEIA